MATCEDKIKEILANIEKDVLKMRSNLNTATKMIEDQTKSLNVAVKLLAESMNISDSELTEMMADIENTSNANDDESNEIDSLAGPSTEAEDNINIDTLHRVD